MLQRKRGFPEADGSDPGLSSPIPFVRTIHGYLCDCMNVSKETCSMHRSTGLGIPLSF